MPPTRRKPTSGTGSSQSSKTTKSGSHQQQRTLAFGPQNTGNKITKPGVSSSTTSSAAAKKAADLVAASTTTVVKPETGKAEDVVADEVVEVIEASPELRPEDARNDPISDREEKEEEEEEEVETGKTGKGRLSASAKKAEVGARGGRGGKQQQGQPPTQTPEPTTTTTKPSPADFAPPSSAQPSSHLPILEVRALSLPESALRSYWAGKEASRLAPRVHQSELSLYEKILREFDLSSQFGPCVGIGRLKRWHRAQGLGLDPPIEVLGVLVRLREEEEEAGKGKGKNAGKNVGGKGKGKATTGTGGAPGGGTGAEWNRAGLEALIGGGRAGGGGATGVTA